MKNMGKKQHKIMINASAYKRIQIAIAGKKNLTSTSMIREFITKKIQYLEFYSC
jgi:hypothetical protein